MDFCHRNSARLSNSWLFMSKSCMYSKSKKYEERKNLSYFQLKIVKNYVHQLLLYTDVVKSKAKLV